MSDDLEVLEPSGSSVTYRGETLELKPLTIGALPKLVRVARPAVDKLLAMGSLPGEDDEAGMVRLVLDLLENHADQVFAAAAICTEREQDWLEGGAIDDFIKLAVQVFEVNRDFFVKRLAPLLAGRAGAAQTTGDGPTPSSSSSSADTA